MSTKGTENTMYECRLRSGRRLPRVPVEGRQTSFLHLPLHFKAILLKDEGWPPFGPHTPGVLSQIQDSEREDLMRSGVGRRELRARLLRLSKRPLVTLTYEAGRKYTLGNPGVVGGRPGIQEGDEFFTFNPRPLLVPPKEEDELYFILQCEDEDKGSLSISSLRQDVLLSVNGVAVVSSSQQRLEFGDVVSLSVPSGGEEEMRLICDFLFQPSRKRGSPSPSFEGPVDMGSVELCTLANHLIVEHILSLLPTEEVLRLRLLSSLWNEEGLQVLRTRKSQVRVSICQIRDANSQDVPDYTSSRLYPLTIPHWKVALPPFEKGCEWDCWDHSMEAHRDMERRRRKEAYPTSEGETKALAELTSFMNQHQPLPVESLVLTGTLKSKGCLSIVQVLLEGLKESLTTLSLDMSWVNTTFPHFPHEIQLPSLKSLSLSLKIALTLDLDPVKRFLSSVDKIETLNLSDLRGSNRSLSTQLLSEIVRLQNNDPSSFANLTTLSIHEHDWSLDSVNLIALAALREGSLKKLKIGPVGRGIHPLRFSLERHAESLEELDLALEVHCHQHPLKWEPYIDVAFPERMPKLTRLSVTCHVDPRWNSHWTVVRIKVPRRGGAGSVIVDRIDYARHFPSLSHLSVQPTSLYHHPATGELKERNDPLDWRTFPLVLTPFVQPVTDDDGGIVGFPSIQHVDIPFQLKGKYHGILDQLEGSFPKAIFPPELEDARRGPVWNEEEEDEDPSLPGSRIG